MKIAVIGTGNMGGGIARALAGKHEVLIGSRDPAGAAARAKELGATGARSYGDAAAGADVVFLAIPWTSVEGYLGQLGDLEGKVLVDITNPYVGGGLKLHDGTSDAEEIQKRVPRARVVKGWNTIFSGVVNAGPDFDGEAASVFLAGDDESAKATVASLAQDMGYEPIDCGPLASARDLERLLSCFGAIGHGLEHGRWSLKVLKR